MPLNIRVPAGQPTGGQFAAHPVRTLDSIHLVVDNILFVLPKKEPVPTVVTRDMPRPETIQRRVDLANERFEIGTLAFD